ATSCARILARSKPQAATRSRSAERASSPDPRRVTLRVPRSGCVVNDCQMQRFRVCVLRMVRPARLRTSLELAEELGRLIARSRRRVWNTAAQQLEQVGESIFSWQLLSHLVRQGPSSQRELSIFTAQHPAGVSRTLYELERAGYVRRRR